MRSQLTPSQIACLAADLCEQNLLCVGDMPVPQRLAEIVAFAQVSANNVSDLDMLSAIVLASLEASGTSRMKLPLATEPFPPRSNIVDEYDRWAAENGRLDFEASEILRQAGTGELGQRLDAVFARVLASRQLKTLAAMLGTLGTSPSALPLLAAGVLTVALANTENRPSDDRDAALLQMIAEACQRVTLRDYAECGQDGLKVLTRVLNKLVTALN